MVYLVDGKLGRIPTHPDLTDAKALALPVYSPAIDDTCPDHPDSPRFTASGRAKPAGGRRSNTTLPTDPRRYLIPFLLHLLLAMNATFGCANVDLRAMALDRATGLGRARGSFRSPVARP
jgi:hypothetical protein